MISLNKHLGGIAGMHMEYDGVLAGLQYGIFQEQDKRYGKIP
jgi:hypothetical protein